MNELGKISTVTHGGAKASNPAQDRNAGSTKATPMKIADDDAAAASIRGTYRKEATDTHQNISNNNGSGICFETMEEFIEAVRKEVARFLELLEQIAGGHFMHGNLAESMAETIANLESGRFSPAQAGQEILKTLPFRDIDPEQVLFLLRNN